MRIIAVKGLNKNSECQLYHLHYKEAVLWNLLKQIVALCSTEVREISSTPSSRVIQQVYIRLT